MDVEVSRRLRGAKRELWASFLQKADLLPDEGVERTVLVWENDTLLATGSRQGNVLKCIAVEESRQGEGLTATLLTALRQDALESGFDHLFLYTKPKNQAMFASLFFYPVAQTEEVLLMENRRGGVEDFLAALPEGPAEGTVGAAVMHCNPFTRGHRKLIETAAGECDHLYIFVLSEEGGPFPAKDRLELVKKGTADLPNVTVLPTGPYLISSATFPTYFLKDRDKLQAIQCRLDAEVFCRHFVPRFHITRRYVGTEPLCAATREYNEALLSYLPARGVEVCVVQRLEEQGAPISASAVRALLGQGREDKLRQLVPETTLEYLKERGLL